MPITPGLDSRDAFEAATSAQEQRLAAEREKTRAAEEEAEARALAAKKALADERELRELYPLSDICEKAISDLFRLIDKNDNKQIEFLEHKDVAKKLHSFTMPLARWKWEEKDTDGDGKISVKEWRAAMHEIKVQSGEEHLLWAIIRSFDEHPLAVEARRQAGGSLADPSFNMHLPPEMRHGGMGIITEALN